MSSLFPPVLNWQLKRRIQILIEKRHYMNVTYVQKKRATVSKSFLLLYKMSDFEWRAKERPWANRSNPSSQKKTGMIHSLSIIFFTMLFDRFSLLFPPKSKLLPWLFAPSLFAQLLFFKKSNRSDSLLSLFTKERPWAIHSRCSLQKSDGSDSLFSKSESLFRYFAHKKQVICSKNQRANSQPW